MFENVVAQCIDAGLASGQRYAADSSIIAAEANRQNSAPKADGTPEAINPDDARRAVREYLDTLNDTAFGSGPMLDWLVEKRENDLYVCPVGKALRKPQYVYRTGPTGANKDETERCQGRKGDCELYDLKERCCPKSPQRKVTRCIYETSRNIARALSQTQQYAISCKLRKIVEMPFAQLKRIHGFGRLRLRGVSRDHGHTMTLTGSACGPHDEFIVAATAQTLKS